MKVLHGPEANQSASSSKACFAVNRNSSGIGLSEVVVTDFEELIDDVIGWRGAIDKKEVIVVYLVLQEVLLVVLLFVESYDSRNSESFEYLNILVRVVTISLVDVTSLDRAHKSHEFTGNYPVGIPVLDSFEELVLLHVECLEVVPAELNGVL